MRFLLHGKKFSKEIGLQIINFIDELHKYNFNVLYTEYFIDFQLSGIVLLLAMIGAIVLTHVYKPTIKRQNIDKQNTTYSKDRVKLVKAKSGEGINIDV